MHKIQKRRIKRDDIWTASRQNGNEKKEQEGPERDKTLSKQKLRKIRKIKGSSKEGQNAFGDEREKKREKKREKEHSGRNN